MHHYGQMPQTEQLSVAQAARILGESRWTTQRRIRSGELPATRVGDTVYVIDKAEVDKIVDERTAASAP